MKKLFLICTLALCVTGLYAQPSNMAQTLRNRVSQKIEEQSDSVKIIPLTEENMDQVVNKIFAQEEPKLSQKGEKGFLATKRWQLAYFIAIDFARWEKIRKVKANIEKHIRSGSVAQGFILYDREALKEEEYDQTTNGLYLIPITKDSLAREDAPLTTYKIESSSTTKLLYLLFKKMANEKNFYNFLYVSAHGNSETITYSAQRKLDIKTFFKAIKKNNLHIDVLHLGSCLMGTVANAKALLSEANIDYAILSSNNSLGFSTYVPAFSELTYLAPRAAAEEYSAEFFKAMGHARKTWNLMLLSRKDLQDAAFFENFDRWWTLYKKTPLTETEIPENTEIQERGLTSLRQAMYVWAQKKENVRLLQEAKLEDFMWEEMTTGATFAKVPFLRYYCWDAHNQKTLFHVSDLKLDEGPLPLTSPYLHAANSGCIDGFSVKKSWLLRPSTLPKSGTWSLE